MSKHDDCYWGEYLAEYSMNLCNHPANKKHRSDANCRGCGLFQTYRQHRLAELETEIAVREAELAKLKRKEARMADIATPLSEDLRNIQGGQKQMAREAGGEMKDLFNLEKCPHCGGIAQVIDLRFKPNRPFDSYENYYVSCIRCGARTGTCETTDMAVEKWNRRVSK